MISPSRSAFLQTRQPLVLTSKAPNATPYELYRRLARPNAPSFLLESGIQRHGTGRYSFFGTNPYLVLTGKGHRYELRRPEMGSIERKEGDPWQTLVDAARRSRMPRQAHLPPFIGGAVGVLSYDLVTRFEPVSLKACDDLCFPDLQFLFCDLVAAVDHDRRMMHLIFAPPIDRFEGDPREKLYREGCDRLHEWHARLLVPTPKPEPTDVQPLTITPDQTADEYVDRVRQCQAFIQAGDIYQANLSHRFTLRWRGDPSRSSHHTALDLYGRLRTVNPSPFTALMDLGSVSIISGSPERLVRLAGRRADTRPVAGTRPRGRTPDEDGRLVAELLASPKERAEHVMLLDLERNDLGRVCRYGTVRVDEFMTIEQYSHVNHIVSNVSGELRAGLDGFDLVQAMFPGGTITGVPKIRCMQIIDVLEPVRRGLYTGSLGYVSWSGDLDFNILIRTLVTAGDRGYLQVGAGIVADSIPEREYQETLFKAQAAIQALHSSCGSS